jgi:hypothetical protein
MGDGGDGRCLRIGDGGLLSSAYIPPQVSSGATRLTPRSSRSVEHASPGSPYASDLYVPTVTGCKMTRSPLNLLRLIIRQPKSRRQKSHHLHSKHHISPSCILLMLDVMSQVHPHRLSQALV